MRLLDRNGKGMKCGPLDIDDGSRPHACMMVTVRVADFGRAAPPSRGGVL